MKRLKLLLLILFLSGLFLPFIALAGTYQAGGQTICYEGLVPCGVGKPLKSGANFQNGQCVGGNPVTTTIGGKPTEGIPCQFCHFFVMFDGIVRFVLVIVIIVAVLMFVIGGFMFLAAAGNPGTVQTARKILTSTATGLVIIFASWLIVNTIFIFIGVANWTNLQQGWFIIDCPITL